MFKKSMKIEACLMAFLLFAFMPATVFGQGGGSLTGTVTDASGGVLTNVSIVARNVDTGVETRTASNDRGSYTFPSLPIGTYEITANAAGFSTARSTARLGGTQNSLNISMAVAGTITEVEITGRAESVILEAGSSTGTVMQEEMLQSIPLLSNNVMELINIMGGVTPATDPVFGAASQTFAGVAGTMINVTRDGMSVSEVRNPTGVAANTNINTEMVGEFRMVLSPVDAEMGRGAGQVQMTTRSGSNALHGSVVWNNQNTALDAQDFSQKLTGTPRSWRNLNNYLVTVSGPIIKNRTFFFVTWEQQFARDKVQRNTKVLTPCARKGIYRYITTTASDRNNGNREGWIPTSNSIAGTYNPTNYNMPSVDDKGFPLKGNQTFYHYQNFAPQTFNFDGGLRAESLFGNLTQEARDALLGPGGIYDNCEMVTLNETAMLQGGTDPRGFYSIPGVTNAFAPITAFANQLSGNPTGTTSYFWGGDFQSQQMIGTNPQFGAYRNAYDPTGFVHKLINGADYGYGTVRMPDANNWTGFGDGLNWAGYRWANPLVGDGGSIYGTGGDPDRKSITIKVDHNINNEHRLSGTWTRESYYVSDAYRQWPEEFGGYGGDITRIPQNFLVSLTSTLRPTLLNEGRFGLSLSDTWTYEPTTSKKTGEKMLAVLDTLLPANQWSNGMITLVGVGADPMQFFTDAGGFFAAGPASHPFGSRGNIPGTWGGADPRWTVADTVTWMKGSHSFKGGVEYRLQSSRQDASAVRDFGGNGGLTNRASVYGGNTPATGTRRSNRLTTAYAAGNGWYDHAPGGAWSGLPEAMMTLFSGSMGTLREYFYGVPDGSGGFRWNDPARGEDIWSFTIANQELSFFFKDDWKVTNSLTLNLGIRYEYYGVPYVRDGRTISLKNGGSSIFGISQGGMNNWIGADRMHEAAPLYNIAGNLVDIQRPVGPTEYTYIGKGSTNPDRMAWNKDLNNFAPHLGFAWQLPWLGRGQTTLRGGWSVSYAPVDTFNQFGIYIADIAGISRVEAYSGNSLDPLSQNTFLGNTNNSSDYYMDLTDLREVLTPQGFLDPMKSGLGLPLGTRYVGQQNGFATGFNEDIVSPYLHSLNLSLTRNIGRNLTVDVRYIGTMARTQLNNTNLNQINYMDSRYPLYAELDKIRRGEQSLLINSLVEPGRLMNNGFDFVAGTPIVYSGSDQVRLAGTGMNFATPWGGGSSPSTGANLAAANYSAITTTLAGTNGNLRPSDALTPSTMVGGLLSRTGCLPEDRTTPNDVTTPCTKGIPYNFYYTNPQYSSATLYYNESLTNYHSMQAQVTLRPTRGLNFQATYTWSRNLANSGWTNYLGERDYLLTGQHRSHALNTYGTWELPFGTNGFLFRDASGAFKKAIEGWQLNWVTTMSSGAPVSVTGAATMWNNTWPILARPDLWDDKAGHVTQNWSDDGRYLGAKYLGDRYTKVLDPVLCDPSRMDSRPLYTDFNNLQSYSMYETYCKGPNTASSRLEIIDRGTAPRALALADPSQPDGVARYTADTMGADGIMYKAGDPIVVFRNATQWDGPNSAGNYTANRLTGQGRFSFDLAMSKSIEFMEGKRLEVRVDAQNILNHATPTAATAASYGGRFMSISNPAFAVNNTAAIGNLPTKAGHRTYQARIRLSF